MPDETENRSSETGVMMSAEEQRAFFDMADRFLAVANGLAGEVPVSRISAAMMYATARFNAFLAQTQGLAPGEIDEATVRYFRAEYEKMLRENLGQVLSARQVKNI